MQTASKCRAQKRSWGKDMTETKHRKLRLSASVTPKQKAALENIAQRSEVSISRVIHEAIKEFLDRHAERELPLFKGQLSSE
jgi:hypothetical protein